MHRTQIILEDWQYRILRARAEQEGRSISSLVRELLDRTLVQAPQGKLRIEQIEGIGEDSSSRGRDHDRFLYGVKDKK